jgi:hypothetical protein
MNLGQNTFQQNGRLAHIRITEVVLAMGRNIMGDKISQNIDDLTGFKWAAAITESDICSLLHANTRRQFNSTTC